MTPSLRIRSDLVVVEFAHEDLLVHRLTRVIEAVGEPELVAEVAASTASYDLHDKLRAYQRNGVREYVVWRVLDRAIDWFVLRDDRYEPLALTSAGCYRSQVFPGLWLDPTALIRGDLARVLAVVQQGMASNSPLKYPTFPTWLPIRRP